MSKPPSPPPIPKPPEPLKKPVVTGLGLKDAARKRAAAGGLTGTNLTGGLGVGSMPMITRLGQGGRS